MGARRPVGSRRAPPLDAQCGHPHRVVERSDGTRLVLAVFGQAVPRCTEFLYGACTSRRRLALPARLAGACTPSAGAGAQCAGQPPPRACSDLFLWALPVRQTLLYGPVGEGWWGVRATAISTDGTLLAVAGNASGATDVAAYPVLLANTATGVSWALSAFLPFSSQLVEVVGVQRTDSGAVLVAAATTFPTAGATLPSAPLLPPRVPPDTVQGDDAGVRPFAAGGLQGHVRVATLALGLSPFDAGTLWTCVDVVVPAVDLAPTHCGKTFWVLVDTAFIAASPRAGAHDVLLTVVAVTMVERRAGHDDDEPENEDGDACFSYLVRVPVRFPGPSSSSGTGSIAGDAAVATVAARASIPLPASQRDTLRRELRCRAQDRRPLSLTPLTASRFFGKLAANGKWWYAPLVRGMGTVFDATTGAPACTLSGARHQLPQVFALSCSGEVYSMGADYTWHRHQAWRGSPGPGPHGGTDAPVPSWANPTPDVGPASVMATEPGTYANKVSHLGTPLLMFGMNLNCWHTHVHLTDAGCTLAVGMRLVERQQRITVTTWP